LEDHLRPLVRRLRWPLLLVTIVLSCAACPSSGGFSCPADDQTLELRASGGSSARTLVVDEASASVNGGTADIVVWGHETGSAAGRFELGVSLENSRGAISPGTYLQAATNKYESKLLTRMNLTIGGQTAGTPTDSTIPQRVEVVSIDAHDVCVRVDASGLSGTFRAPRT